MSQASAADAYLPLIEAELRAALACPDPGVQRHYGMMAYHMGWLDAGLRPIEAPGGKRIRPLLCLAACAAAGGDPRRAAPAAAGLELLHNFSLLHDDIEDNSVTRRHRPAAWVSFGVPAACNAGDAMLALAHLALLRLLDVGVPGARVAAALRRFDETCVALTEGQFLDLSFEGRMDVRVEEYERMIAGKTGALLAAAPEIGALVAGSGPDTATSYRRYGAALGRAYQLRDDILGIWGDESVTGKPAAGDVASKKKSLPVLHALSHPRVGPHMQELYAGPPFGPAEVAVVLALLAEAAARDVAEDGVRCATAEGFSALDDLRADAEPRAHGMLVDMLDALAERVS